MKIFASDFETTTDNPEKVSVWSAESIQVGKEIEAVSANCIHQTNIDDFIRFLLNETKQDDTRWYFHNLKFDGAYILDYLIKNPIFSPFENKDHSLKDKEGMKRKEMAVALPDCSFTYQVNDKNVIYQIVIKRGEFLADIRDSLKIMPFPLRKIAKDFHTAHKKLEMDYGNKQPGYSPTQEEMAYIENDVFVLKEAIEIFADLTECPLEKLALTIGSVAMNYYRRTIDANAYYGYHFKKMFPSQMEEINNGVTFDEYIRKSYKGGWCYCKPSIKGKVLNEKGFVYDVNSLYPSVMHSSSGCFYPVGEGHIRAGDLEANEQSAFKRGKLYYFIRVRCEFHIKSNYLPTIQIKGDPLYNGTVWLESSDVWDKYQKKKVSNRPLLTLTCTDWELMKEHYTISRLEVIDHINYHTRAGIFDKYIDHWYEIKKHSKGAVRTLAKLMLNNLYGKFSTAPVGDYIFYTLKDNVLKSNVFDLDDDSRAVYIPVGSAITAWARNFTIRHAQENFKIFCYADTDSIHCIGKKTEAKGIKESPTDLCCWKNETNWDKAIFAGQKRYIEHVIEEDSEAVEPYNNIKCCGMGVEAKNTLDEFLQSGKYDYSIFHSGLMVGGNIKAKRVDGGIFLEEKAFTFREIKFMME